MNREHRAFDDTYWRERNDAAYFDDSILRYAESLRAQMDRLKALPGVGALHEEAVGLHKAKRDALLAQDSYREMQTQLRGANRYSAAEAAIIEEIAAL